MLIPNHPDEERLSALAAHDDDAVADGALASHVADCAGCTEIVTELGALRASLAELPDLVPSRPLRLLPPAEEPSSAPAAAGVGTWVRRLFAPAMTAGVALAMVGLVGTAGPVFESLAIGGAQSGPDADMEAGGEQPAASLAEALGSSGEERDGAGEPAAAPGGTASSDDLGEFAEASPAATREHAAYDPFSNGGDSTDESARLPAQRSPWPMVLFSGVAIVVGALLLRWILVPRAG